MNEEFNILEGGRGTICNNLQFFPKYYLTIKKKRFILNLIKIGLKLLTLFDSIRTCMQNLKIIKNGKLVSQLTKIGSFQGGVFLRIRNLILIFAGTFCIFI